MSKRGTLKKDRYHYYHVCESRELAMGKAGELKGLGFIRE